MRRCTKHSTYWAIYALSVLALSTLPNASAETTDGPGYVTIGSQRVLTRAQQENEAERQAKAALPSQLRSDAFIRAMKSRDRITPPASAPRIGESTAPITIYEFSDLSCAHCASTMKKIDEILSKDEFKGHVQRVYIHAPADKFTPTNPSAFYSKIAQHDGSFWDFRNRMIAHASPSDADMVKFLMEQEITISTIRKNLRENTRTYYNDLDAEAAASRVIVRGELPFYIVNGIMIGSVLNINNLEPFLRYEMSQQEQTTQ